MENNNYCNNCGKMGHLYNHCKMPITSVGIIAFRVNNNNIEFLMIRRKETLGFIDFIRGKYSLNDKKYICNMIAQMTHDEKHKLLNNSFDEIWKEVWCNEQVSCQYKFEETLSCEKFVSLKEGIYNKGDFYNLEMLINMCNINYVVPEWGFPKGRRNFHENDYDCAIREFCEETGYDKKYLNNIQNMLPIDEIFTGSNYKSYKHKYFLMYMNNDDTNNIYNYQKSEVSKMDWFTYNDCMNQIRDYNLEKKNVLQKVNNVLKQLSLCIL